MRAQIFIWYGLQIYYDILATGVTTVKHDIIVELLDNPFKFKFRKYIQENTFVDSVVMYRLRYSVVKCVLVVQTKKIMVENQGATSVDDVICTFTIICGFNFFKP